MDKDARIENEENSLLNEEKALERREFNGLERERQSIVNKENKLINQQKKLELKEKQIEDKENKILGKQSDFEERGKNILNFIKTNPAVIFYVVLILLLVLGVYIRYQPLTSHGGLPGLWDITTNDYTLGPDLDPFLFLRYAKDMISTGGIPVIDNMRNVPLGFDTTTELQMVSYMIVLTYKIINIFGTYSANYAGAFMPVWMFGLTIIAFFLFVRQLFLRKIENEDERKKNYIQANIIATIATLFMIVMPGFLSRTVAGIPEKESVGFFFMFLAFYLFLRAWKSEKLLSAGILGILAGVATALMGLTWGGVTYIYITIGLAGLVALILNKVEIKESIVYSTWLIAAMIITFSFTNRFSLGAFVTSIDSGLAIVTLGVIVAHLIIWRTRLNQYLKLDKIRLPKTIISLIIAIVIGIIIIMIIFGPSFFIEKIKVLNQTLIKPVTGRWSTTVAENRQPYFSEWVSSLGSFIFWGLVIGSILLFKRMFSKLDKKESWILTGLYILFLFGLMFSRYAPHPALLDGEGALSKLLYFGSAILLVGVFLYYYFRDNKKGNTSFETADFEYIFLFALLVLCLFTARSAIRLIMVLVPIAPILFAYLVVEGYNLKSKIKDDTMRIILVIIIIVIAIFGVVQVYSFYKDVKLQSYSFIPSSYTQQWQKAMEWVRSETPANAVFAHWWDYGYWLQSIGDRATVTDGGNAIVWWNYLTGRFVLTGDNQKDALEFLYNHNATNLLIDSSDIGKYGAFSQIGSDENFDRLSHGPVGLISEAANTQETKDGSIRLYNRPAGDGRVYLTPLEEDLIYSENGTTKKIYRDNSALIGIKIKYIESNTSQEIVQPEAIFSSDGIQKSVQMRYIYYNGKIYDYHDGIEATAYIIQKLNPTNNGVQLDPNGAIIYLSPRVMRGLLGQLYILNDPLNNFPNFKLAHTQPNPIIESINGQGQAELGEFIYYGDIQGPIKIWDIEYKGDEKINPEYLLTQAPANITWQF